MASNKKESLQDAVQRTYEELMADAEKNKETLEKIVKGYLGTETKSNLYLYSLKETEELTGIKVQMLRLYIKQGKLKANRIGKQYKVSKENLEKFIQEITA